MSSLDKKDSSQWILLNEEEKRCLLGLQKYYTSVVGKSEPESMELAWADLKKEFPARLATAIWWK